MKRQYLLSILIVIGFLSHNSSESLSNVKIYSPDDIQKPLLKWMHGGCYSSWCETGWYSSSAVADLDNNGSVEVIGAAYSIFILNGNNGNLIKQIKPDWGRQWPSLVVADLDNDTDLEIVTAHGGGYLHVFDHQGNTVWWERPTPGNELRSLAAYDIDGDQDLEIVVASTSSDNQWFVYEHDGSLRAGEWPQHDPDSDTNGYAAGCFNENVAVGDIDGDGYGEIIGANDTHYLAAFEDNGAQVEASQIYGTNPDGSNKFWSRVGVHVDHYVDLRGYAHCSEEHRPNFAHSAPIIVDVNGDRVNETVVVGNNYNCGTNPYSSLFEMPYIFNSDRTRWSAGDYDWTDIPTPDGDASPLSENYNEIENNQPNAVAFDLDGDGISEVLYPSYDGRLHALWLDKTEHGDWPYEVTIPSEGVYRFASEPAIADLNDDGFAEVIFATWVEKGSYKSGKLIILNHLGEELQNAELPAAFGSPNWNGALAAPTIANIDNEPEYEIVVNTAHSGIVAYDLPGTENAKLLWATGRANFQRSGSLLKGNLFASSLAVSHIVAEPGEVMAYTIWLSNPGPDLMDVSLMDILPEGLSFVGGLTASSGIASEQNNEISWLGEVKADNPVRINFSVKIDTSFQAGSLVENIVEINDGIGSIWRRNAKTLVGGDGLYLPIVTR